MRRIFVGFGQNAVNQEAPEWAGWAGLLAGCVPDARDLAIMYAVLGYQCRCIYSGWNIGKVGPVPAKDWLLTLNCTRQAFRDVHEELQSIQQPGDKFVISNSGHGGKYDTAWGYGAGTEMCFADGSLKDTEFHRDLMSGWKSGVSCTYILDTCFSAGMRSANRRIRYRPDYVLQAPAEGTRMAEAFRAQDFEGSILRLAAASATQTAADGDQNGAFTGTLLAVMEQNKSLGLPPLTYRAAMDQTKILMGTAFDQTPVLDALGAGDVNMTP